MARLARFELTTLAFGGQYSIQLSYKRTMWIECLYNIFQRKSSFFYTSPIIKIKLIFESLNLGSIVPSQMHRK